MKNISLIIGIIVVIGLIHVAVLYFVLRAPGAPKGVEPTSAPAEQETAPASAGAETGTAPVQPAPNSISPEEYRKIRLNAKLNTPAPTLNYSGSLAGNLKELPGSAAASTGILYNMNTGMVLWSKNPRSSVPIASITKIMTELVAYEDILSGRSPAMLSTKVQVTKAAAKIGGSQVYLDPRESFSLEELFKAASIKSANDATYLIAEYMGGGSVPTFVARMNARAEAIGLTGTHFYNPHGLPGETSKNDNVSTPEDLVKLASVVMRHDQLMEWAGTHSAVFRADAPPAKQMQLKNHNHLLPGGEAPTAGVNGLKTGYTKRSGYCVVATCDRNGSRMIAVVTGFPDRHQRDNFVRSLFEWGYARNIASGAHAPGPAVTAPLPPPVPGMDISSAPVSMPVQQPALSTGKTGSKNVKKTSSSTKKKAKKKRK